MSFYTKLPDFRNIFRIFQEQMFLANNMIHQPFKARLKLALPCYVIFLLSPLSSPLISPTHYSYLIVAMQSVLQVKFEGDEFYH